MKGREVERLAKKHLLPVLPSFAARRSLVYRRPVEDLLYAVSFDTSSFTSSRIFVAAFVQPLFVPVDFFWSTFGDRLGETPRDEWWDVDEANPDPAFASIADIVRRDALRLFRELDGLDRFCEVVPQRSNADDPVVLEALGYAELLRGHDEESLRLLNAALQSEREDDEYSDEPRIANLEHMIDLVERSGPDAGRAQLAEWRAQTLSALRLETL